MSKLVGILFVGSFIFYQERKKEEERGQKKWCQAWHSFQTEMRNRCIKLADDEYSSFVQLNGEKVHGKGKDVNRMSLAKWEYIEKKTKEAKQECSKDWAPINCIE